MIHFAWPWMLLLLPLPWLVGRFVPPAKPRGSALFLPFAATVSADATPYLRANSRLRMLLFALLWLLLVVSATRPQWLDEPQPVSSTGRRLMMAVDASGSMAEQDMAGRATRLQVVQAVAGDFIRRRTGDQVGLILFGTRPYLQAPLTADLETVGQFLQEAVIGVAGTQTAIGDAIGLAIKRLQANLSESDGNMVMILLTDGGNDAGLMDPIPAARMAADAKLRIYTIGVGSAQPFNVSNNRLDEGTLKSIANITGGTYFRAADASDLLEIYAQIDKLEPSSGQAQWYRPSTEWFPWPLGIALLLSVLVVILREPR